MPQWGVCGNRLFLQRLHDARQHRLGVAEEHQRVVGEEQLVLDAGEPGVHAALDDEDRLGLVGVDDRHAVDRARFVVPGGRVDHVVGPDDQRDVGLGHLGIDLVHLDQLVVGNLGLGQQHVHVPGHAAGHRVDGELHVDAFFGQRVVQLAHAVLGLGHGHAVAGNDDHAGQPT